MRILSLLLYNLAIRLYGFGISVASLWDAKAKLWIKGRINQEATFEKLNGIKGKRIWFHCASLGEFEQARPVIETIKKQFPDVAVILTFFSPSGYEIRRNYEFADLVAYLPLDTEENAKSFLEQLKPDVALFVKYEFWYHIIRELKQRDIPILLFSSVFRADQIFFKPYGILFREILGMFSKIYVQSKASQDLLSSIGIKSEVAYDTRFDRVLQIAGSRKLFPAIEKFKDASKLFIAGSTWGKDDELICRLIREKVLPGYKYIIAPHQVDPDKLNKLRNHLPEETRLFSELTADNAVLTDVVLVDNTGNLASLYAYADIAYIGGGFNASVHNVLEAAVYGLPIIFGPNFHKSIEAMALRKKLAAFSVDSYSTLHYTLDTLNDNHQLRMTYASLQSRQYVRARSGGSEIIFNYLIKYL